MTNATKTAELTEISNRAASLSARGYSDLAHEVARRGYEMATRVKDAAEWRRIFSQY